MNLLLNEVIKLVSFEIEPLFQVEVKVKLTFFLSASSSSDHVLIKINKICIQLKPELSTIFSSDEWWLVKDLSYKYHCSNIVPI